jgi:hypothetical protein
MTDLTQTVDAQHSEIEQLKAERDALKPDAERYRWLRDTFSAAKAGAILHVNEPLMVYEKPKLGTEVRLQWYPNTPVCFLCVEHSTLDAAIDAARGDK